MSECRWKTHKVDVPADGEMCGDCAFLPKSREHRDDYPGVNLEQIRILAEGALAMGFPPKPFYCHAGMEPNGKGGYVPWPSPRDPRWRKCEGWKRMARALLPAGADEKDFL